MHAGIGARTAVLIFSDIGVGSRFVVRPPAGLPPATRSRVSRGDNLQKWKQAPQTSLRSDVLLAMLRGGASYQPNLPLNLTNR